MNLVIIFNILNQGRIPAAFVALLFLIFLPANSYCQKEQKEVVNYATLTALGNFWNNGTSGLGIALSGGCEFEDQFFAGLEFGIISHTVSAFLLATEVGHLSKDKVIQSVFTLGVVSSFYSSYSDLTTTGFLMSGEIRFALPIENKKLRVLISPGLTLLQPFKEVFPEGNNYFNYGIISSAVGPQLRIGLHRLWGDKK